MTILANTRKFKEAMFLKGFNLSDLSRETGVGISYLSQIINGKKIPSPKLAKKMAEVLQVEVNELFEFEVKEA
ncbi:TPA: helix-turn-helix transcriptional regulator [Staphylococcus aureus]|jgi:transcriptional regulator with XRE-family HTH domain|uniref:Helix-turn-helix XRE family protein n=4 Tax=Staphylococcus aureus TaxID=1280 RepID=A0FIL6_STAAU|nr:MULTISPECIES: helix-turn-helix transcriptional regulator [Staphylococcus]MBN4933029.1 helix-turn-helix transcriptional regulator [Staphylococcus sp. EG-SA-6]CYR90773.1 Helix-turn-helix domain [Streptococcus pneumoniae]HDH6338233.1 helix-turn-helix transcriptional regulator [Staphylococcus aureus LTCF-1-1]HDH6340954.1 helix-turn-helix transcriptional regulator [Staphylococcus aureus LTCF-1-2]HDH6435643.1 helix-turn-helix transcriptional regulator [Staphylococcus aureus MRSA-Lux-30]HDK908772